jgi:Toprim-like
MCKDIQMNPAAAPPSPSAILAQNPSNTMPKRLDEATERAQRQAELDRFKRQIDLVKFAQGYDYKVTQRSGSYTRLRRAKGDQIIVTRESDGTFVWVNPENCQVRDNGAPKSAGYEQGTIIDFLQRERRFDLAGVRKELRQHLGSVNPSLGGPAVADASATGDLRPHPSFDRETITRRVLAALVVRDSDYLAARGIRPQTLIDERFAGTVRIRPHSGEVLFPHSDQEGYTGFERKHPRYTLFATGGRRAVWHSTIRSADKVLVVAESGIDCLSYHQLNPRPDARYMSTGGTLSSTQAELLGRAIAKLPPDGAVVAATDNDEAGRKMADQLERIAHAARPGIAVEKPFPPRGHKDWNDVLKEHEHDFIQQAKRRVRGIAR